MTPNGLMGFSGVAHMGDFPIWALEFANGKKLECTLNHKLLTSTGVKTIADLSKGDAVLCGDGTAVAITKKKETGKLQPVFDLVEVDGGHLYTTNGLVSHNCNFVTDDETLIAPMKLAAMTHHVVNPTFYTGRARWYVESLEPNKTYVVALDPSHGVGRDYAAIQIFQLPEMIQVGEWQHNESTTRNQVRVLMQILIFLDGTLRDNPDQHGEPEIFWTVENNGLGEAVLQVIEDTGEERFPGMFISEKKKKGQVRRFRKGFNTNNSKKMSACARLKSLVESDRAIINSLQLLTELKNFVSTENSFGAKPGEHDDLVSATLLVVRMLEVVLGWSNDTGDLKEYIGDEEIYEGEPMPVLF
jgi:hypothetical protein